MSDRVKLSIVAVVLAVLVALVMWQVSRPSATPKADTGPQVTAPTTSQEPRGVSATTFGDLRLPGGFAELNPPVQRTNALAAVSVGAWRTKGAPEVVIASLLEKNAQWTFKSRDTEGVLTLVTKLPESAGKTRTLEVAVLHSEAAGGTLVRAVDTTYLTGTDSTQTPDSGTE